MHAGPSGFHNAPVTRTLVITSAILTVAAGLRGRSHRLGLSYQVGFATVSVSIRLPYRAPTSLMQDTIENRNIWKFIPSVFAFSSSPELIIGLYLLYYFRVFERQIGSNKYSVFVLFSLIVSTAFEVLALALLKDSRTSAAGPYGLIFASFIPFYFDIPVTSRFHMFGINFSDKSAIYCAGFQLLLCAWKSSFVPGICGALAGFLFRINAFGIRKLKWFVFLIVIQRNYPSVGHIPMPEPPESSIAMLVSMGFNSNAARQALMQARNDINAATNILLEAQTR
ncbi:UBA [Musa troglodytarum]|uniref:UBA n=1 Tax=Musa troglodytarum TaxID=320322 RepID=A0A9E7G4J1_9LILI|nr:UBA [Musa troglodytarum]